MFFVVENIFMQNKKNHLSYQFISGECHLSIVWNGKQMFVEDHITNI